MDFATTLFTVAENKFTRFSPSISDVFAGEVSLVLDLYKVVVIVSD